MKFDCISRYPYVEVTVKKCLRSISVNDAKHLAQKLEKKCEGISKYGTESFRHTFRELIFGAYLRMNNFQIKLGSIDGKTPDWLVFGTDSSLTGIAELTNTEIDFKNKNKIDNQSLVSFIRDEFGNNVGRVYNRIQEKARKYSPLAKNKACFYIIGVYAELELGMDFQELLPNLTAKDGLFVTYPEVSCVLFFKENHDNYEFYNALNPHALRPIPPTDFVRLFSKK